jgi:hypothetical protein
MLSSPVYTEFHPRPPKSSPVSLFFPNVQPANLPTCLRCPNSSKILPHPRPFLCRQHYAPISSLAATRTNPPASVADKRLTPILTPIDAKLTKNRGGGVFRTLRFNFQMLTVNLPIPNPLPYLVTSLRPPFGAHLPQRSIAPPKGNAILDLAHSKCPKE